jgi:2-polyprenyl-3-methyl-5-hydroxy-6-metoxy-1,4-benzoquinol methylase
MDLEAYDLFECPACGCWSSSALAKRAVTSFEPERYFANATSDRAKWARLFETLKVERDAPLRILDVGCSNGHFLAYARSMLPVARLDGIEIDPTTAERARRLVPDANILVGDADRALGSVEARYDLVTMWDVFEHLTAPAKALERLASLLSPGGRIYVQTIHEHSVLPTIGRVLYRASAGRIKYPARRTHDAHHLVFFSRRGLELAAERAGLAIEASWHDRLARERMDGNPVVTAVSAALLAAENALGNGLFINLVLRKPSATSAPARSLR